MRAIHPLGRILLAWALLGCQSSAWAGWFGPSKPAGEQKSSKQTIFVGIDISQSFRANPVFHDALDFLAHYLYVHIHGLGGAAQPKALFVSSIGGDYKDDPQVFRTLFDFENKSVAQIKSDLNRWYNERDRITDFSMFFESVADTVKKRSLALTPITIIIISDGIPLGSKIAKTESEYGPYKQIKFGSIEYLARNVTVRLLYAPAKAAKNWEDNVPRKRVRLWTEANDEVMRGWRNTIRPNLSMKNQKKFFEWLKYNVDFRVRVKKF